MLRDELMASVRLSWCPFLVEVRRETCPKAQWHKQKRYWVMSDRDACRFIHAAHGRLEAVRSHAEISIDSERWLVGFVQGAPQKVENQPAM
jgi:hypothetical protein